MTKQGKLKRQKKKQGRFERGRDRTIARLGNNGDGDGDGNGYLSYEEVIYRVLGAVKNASSHNPQHPDRGVKTRGLQQQLGTKADAETIKGVLEGLQDYGIVTNQGSGIYNSLAIPGTDQEAYLKIMLLATQPCPTEKLDLTPDLVASKLGIPSEDAEIYLDDLTKGKTSKGAPLFESEGVYHNSFSWR